MDNKFNFGGYLFQRLFGIYILFNIKYEKNDKIILEEEPYEYGEDIELNINNNYYLYQIKYKQKETFEDFSKIFNKKYSEEKYKKIYFELHNKFELDSNLLYFKNLDIDDKLKFLNYWTYTDRIIINNFEQEKNNFDTTNFNIYKYQNKIIKFKNINKYDKNKIIEINSSSMKIILSKIIFNNKSYSWDEIKNQTMILIDEKYNLQNDFRNLNKYIYDKIYYFYDINVYNKGKNDINYLFNEIKKDIDEKLDIYENMNNFINFFKKILNLNKNNNEFYKIFNTYKNDFEELLKTKKLHLNKFLEIIYNSNFDNETLNIFRLFIFNFLNDTSIEIKYNKNKNLIENIDNQFYGVLNDIKTKIKFKSKSYKRLNKFCNYYYN